MALSNKGLRLVQWLMVLSVLVSPYAFAGKQKDRCERLLGPQIAKLVSELRATSASPDIARRESLAQDLIQFLSDPPENTEELNEMMDVVSALSPGMNSLISSARSHVQIEIGEKSSCYRGGFFYQDRSSTYAPKVTIARNSPTVFFEIVHEIQHAVPLPADFMHALTLDPNAETHDQMKMKLLEFFYMEEAISVEAEIQLNQALANFGVYFDYESIRPGVRARYNSGGVSAIAKDLPQLVPGWQKHYDKMAEDMIAGLKHPLTAPRSWSYAGVTIQSGAGNYSLTLNGAKLREAIAEAAANPELVNQVKAWTTKVGSWLDSLKTELPSPNITQVHPRFANDPVSSLANVGFSKLATPSHPLSTNIDAMALEKLDLRVALAGRFPKLLKSSYEGSKDDRRTAHHFRGLLSLAHHRPDAQASQTYQLLLDDSLSEIRDQKSEGAVHLRDLGLTLIESGNHEQGEQLLKFLIDQHLSLLSLEQVISFLKSLIEAKEWTLLERVFPHLDERMDHPPKWLGFSLVRSYESDGKFTEAGKRKVNEYIERHPLEGVSAEGMLNLVKSLQTSEDFIASSKYVLERPKTYYEKSFAEDMIKLAPHAREFSLIATSLKTDHAPLASAYRSLAAKLYQFSLIGAWRFKEVRIAHLEAEFHVKHDPSKSVQYLKETLLAQQNFNAEYDIAQDLYSGTATVIGHLVRDPNFFHVAIEQLQKMESTMNYIGFYKTLAEQLPANFDPILLQTFLSDWMKKVIDVGESLARQKYIENEGPSNLAAQIKEVPPGVAMPSHVFEIHLVHEHLLKMSELLLKRSEPELTARGVALLDRMRGEKRNFFNRYHYASPTNFFFGDAGAYLLHQIDYFDASIFKISAFVRSAELAPTHAREWLEQGYQIYRQVQLNPRGSNFWQFDEALSAFFGLAKQLVEIGDIARAREILQAMHSSLREAQGHFDSQDSKSDDSSWGQYRIEQAKKQIDFWQQHLDSFMKARLARAYQAQDSPQLAQSLLKELLVSFESEIINRRARFKEKSMTMAAKEISLAAEFAEGAKRAFELSIEKISLTRDQEILNDSNLNFFWISITDSNLDDAIKDHLLTLLVKKVTHTDSIDTRASVQVISALARLANAIMDSGKYPVAELECLRVLNERTRDLHLDRDGLFGSSATLGALEIIFKRIIKNHPELVDSANFSAISTRIQSSDGKIGLASLMPEPSRSAVKPQLAISSGELPNLDQIKAGLIDAISILPRVREELRASLNNHNLSKLDAVLAIYGELVYQEVTQRRLQEDRISLQELFQFKAMSGLFEIIKNRLSSSGSLSVEERRVIATLLAARNSEEAAGKRNLFVDILKNENSPLEVKRMALEGIIKCKYESSFLATYYENNIVVGSEVVQRHFFHVIRTLLDLDVSFPADNILQFLVQDTLAGEEFLARYIQVHGKNVLRRVEAYEFRNNFTKHDYFTARDRNFILQTDLWQPSLLSEADLVIVYQTSFSWIIGFDQYIQDIRSMYVDRSFDIAGPHDYRFTYTADNIESYVRRFVPGFKFTPQERDKIHDQFKQNKLAHTLFNRDQVIALPAERGAISLTDLQKACPRLELSRVQKDKLSLFLHLTDDSRLKILATVFGDYDHYSSNRSELAGILDKVENDFRKLKDEADQEKIETPPWFAELPQLVRFMMTRFFIQLPFGEREALMAEYKAQGRPSTNEIGVRRFFELTHMEKVGQYLSTRRDLLPESYRLELERFQEDGVISSFDEIRATIEGDLKKPLEQVFSHFGQTAIKAGTIGEVYKATTSDGVEVAVKVITPSKRKVLKTMLGRLEKVADDLERIRDRVQGAFNPVKMFRGFAASINAELDFGNELNNSNLFREHLPKGVIIPPYHRDLVGENVLVQEWAKGVHIREITGTRFAKSTIQRLGSMILREITEIGVIHDDIHPGNVRVNPADGTVELFDFGRRGQLTDKERHHLPQLLMAIRSKSVAQVISHLVAVSANAVDYDQRGLTQAISTVLEAPNLTAQSRLDRIFSEAQIAGVEVSEGYLVVVKATTTFEGFARVLDPQFNFEEFIRSYFLKQSVGNIFNFMGDGNSKRQ